VPTLFFVNRFFYPDPSATSQILTDLAEHLAAGGYKVEVITSRLSYENPALGFAPHETALGVQIVRVATTRFGRANLFGRSLDYLSFYLAAFWCLLLAVKRGDVVIAKTDPPLIGVVAAVAARLKGARLVNWLQDVFPEVGTALGVRVLGGPVAPALRMLRDATLKSAVANVVLGERMAGYMLSRSVPAHQVVVIPNWTDDVNIVPTAHADNPLRREWALADRFVVGYSGNLGRAHEMHTILGAAQLLRDQAHIRFLFIGGGAQLESVRSAVSAQQLGNVEFRPYQPRAMLGLSLGAIDLHLVSLNPAVEGLIVPSKFYGIAAAGRPMAFIGEPTGEIGTLVTRFSCGTSIAPGDVAGLAEFILLLAGNPVKAAEMGLKARYAIEENFGKHQSLGAWQSLVARVLQESAGNSVDK
jgi:colanic acid biosynthesis glycosyl transferase WcaI